MKNYYLFFVTALMLCWQNGKAQVQPDYYSITNNSTIFNVLANDNYAGYYAGCNIDSNFSNVKVVPAYSTFTQQGGSLVFNYPANTITYIPAIGFYGTDYFYYGITQDSSGGVCDTARVTIQVINPCSGYSISSISSTGSAGSVTLNAAVMGYTSNEIKWYNNGTYLGTGNPLTVSLPAGLYNDISARAETAVLDSNNYLIDSCFSILNDTINVGTPTNPCDSLTAAAAYTDRVVIGSPYKILLGGAPSAYGGTEPYNYQWTALTSCGSVNNPNIANPVGSVCTNSSMFVLTVTDSIGCVTKDTVYLDTSCGVSTQITYPCDSISIAKSYIDNNDSTITATYTITGLNNPSLFNPHWQIYNHATPIFCDYCGVSDTIISVTYPYGTILTVLAFASSDTAYMDTCGPEFVDTLNYIPTTSVNQLIKTNDIKLYPNPTSDNITLEITGNENLNSEVVIIDIAGQIIKKELLQKSAGINVVKILNVVNISSGTYNIIVRDKQSGNIQKTLRFVKR